MKKVSLFEVISLAVTVVISTSVMFSPYLATRVAGQDSWLAVIFAGLLSSLPAAASVYIMSKFPNKSFPQALPKLVGGFLGKILSVLYAAVFLFLAALTVWRMEAFAVRFLLPDTPLLVIRLLFLLTVFYAAMSGSAPLMRTNAYIVVLQLLVPILAVVLFTARMDFSFLTPLFEGGVKPVINSTVLLLGWFCQAPLVILMFQWLVDAAKLKKGGLKAVLGSLAATIAAGFGFIGILAALGPEQAATTYYPSYALVRIISIGTFLEHTEVVFVVIWVSSIYLAASFFIQAFATSISDTFNIKGAKGKSWLVLSTVIVLVVWPLLHRFSFFNLIATIRDIGSPAGLIFGGVIPLLLFFRVLIAPPRLRKKQQGSEETPADPEPGVFEVQPENGANKNN